MSSRLDPWPFDDVWADVCKLEKDADDAQFSRLREVGIQLDVAGLVPATSGYAPRRPGGADTTTKTRVPALLRRDPGLLFVCA